PARGHHPGRDLPVVPSPQRVAGRPGRGWAAMTTVDTTWKRPRLRPEVRLGPAQRRGRGVAQHVKDPVTGWYYRIGPREHFLLSRMDGSRSLEELGAEYAATFGRRLGQDSWQQLFAMLHKRQLLAGATDDAELARLSAAAARNAS